MFDITWTTEALSVGDVAVSNVWLSIVVVIIVSGIITTMSRSVAASTVLGFYPALALYLYVPTSWIDVVADIVPMGASLLFLLLYLICVTLIHLTLHEYFAGMFKPSFLEGVFLGVGLAILGVSVAYHTLPLEQFLGDSGILQVVFAPEEYRFFHYLLPLLLFFFALYL